MFQILVMKAESEKIFSRENIDIKGHQEEDKRK